MKAILSKAKLGTQPGSRPPAALEITPEGVLAAAISSPCLTNLQLVFDGPEVESVARL